MHNIEMAPNNSQGKKEEDGSQFNNIIRWVENFKARPGMNREDVARLKTDVNREMNNIKDLALVIKIKERLNLDKETSTDLLDLRNIIEAKIANMKPKLTLVESAEEEPEIEQKAS